MFAASLALLAHEFQGRERGLALGVWGAITGAALAIGPVVGGLLVDGPGWRWVFLVNVPVGALLLWLTMTRLPESRDPTPRALDLPGLLTFGGACFLATFALIRGNAEGWGSPQIAGSLAAAALLLVAFVAIESRASSPMLAPSLFRIPAFTGTALVAFAQSVALYPLFLFLALYFQELLRALPHRHRPAAAADHARAVRGRAALGQGDQPGAAAHPAHRRAAADRGQPAAHARPGRLRRLDVPVARLPGRGPGDRRDQPRAGRRAMVGVLSVERSGLASGVNNTFRQLGIAVGIAAFGAMFDHHIRTAAAPADGLVAGLNAIFLAAALVVVVAAVIAWPLLGRLRSST